jgi:hypothetical protein
MNAPGKKTEVLAKKVGHELKEYGINVVYLTIVFATITEYRRLLLAAHDIVYTAYWIPVIEALILGKVISIGGIFHIGRRLEDKPLIYPTLYKTVAFTLLVVVFKLAEHVIKSLVTGEGVAAGIAEFTGQGWKVILANGMILCVALIPFFAMKEMGRVLGREKIARLFFRPGSQGDP